MSSRFWRGGHCSCGGRVLLSCIQTCMCLILHTCLWKEPIAFTFSSPLFQLCVCVCVCVCVRARACPRATVCVPLKSCSCKRRTERPLRFPKTFLPLGERGSPHCPSLCGSLPLLHSVCRNAPSLVMWRGGQGRASR